jgi:Ca-activated chloride channel homolog
MKKIFWVTAAVLLVVVLVLSSCASAPMQTQTQYSQTTTAIQTYRPQTSTAAATQTYRPSSSNLPPPTTTGASIPKTSGGGQAMQTNSADMLGFSTGGAKDIANFRENIRNNYLPLPTDITYEGLFYDYYFDTGASEPSEKLFSPSYSFAVTRDPLSRQTEYYLSVGLNSGLRESDFQRKKLNLVILMDNSGSMGEKYNEYYYDDFGTKVSAYEGEGIIRKTKMDSSIDAVLNILNQLNDDDQFSIVLFNDKAYLAKPMGKVGRTDMDDVRDQVMDITPGGSTNLSAGLDMATKQFRNLFEMDSDEYENRIMVLTDAQPNTGDTSLGGLTSVANRNAENRIYTTVIGIGVDFNTQLIEQITKIKGANYYSVHSPRQFKQRIEEEFDFMVTPLVFDVNLYFESKGWRIEKVFGSPEADQATGRLMTINTLFPSKSVEGQTRGGLVLLKLRKTSSTSSDQPVYLRTSYEDRSGNMDGSRSTIYLESESPEYFDNDGIKKGVLLVRYASLMKNWLQDERQHQQYSKPWDPCINEDTGIIIPDENLIGQWERTSLPLTVSGPYHQIFKDFRDYFESEADQLNDKDLNQELDILNYLIRF